MNSSLTYDQALSYWYGRVNYEQVSPQPEDLRLERMRTLLGLLGDPQKALRIVHVAGSKGKGSTSALLAAILRQAGCRTGLFTSPHLCRVEERFQVDGLPIPQDELAALLSEVRTVIEEAGTKSSGTRLAESSLSEATFFEIATAVGFLHFLRRRVDLAVVEVGLGGRFDSTNVCTPLVALITSISFDHTRQLGNDLASIAMEKAGIIKPGRPVISGVTALEARAVIEQIARQRGTPLRQLDSDFRFAYKPGRVDPQAGAPFGLLPGEKPRVQVFTEQRAWPVLEVGLLGAHQAANAAVAVACVEQLRALGIAIDDRAVAAGLVGVDWPARMEVMGRRPLVILDCAHNVASAQALVETLQASFPPARRLLVFAASNDKDLAGMFRELAPHFAHFILTRYSSGSRSMPPGELAELFRRGSDRPFTISQTAAEAWQAARSLAGPDDIVCVTGSVFLAGELRPLLAG